MQTLSEIKGLSEAKIDKMVEAAKKMSDRGTLMTARELEVRREKEIGKYP